VCRAIKLVVMMTFWQGIGLALLGRLDLLPFKSYWEQWTVCADGEPPPCGALDQLTFSRTIWRLYGGAKGLVVWY
jgi:hypothetical protein